jgi:hypothetical protein
MQHSTGWAAAVPEDQKSNKNAYYRVPTVAARAGSGKIHARLFRRARKSSAWRVAGQKGAATASFFSPARPFAGPVLQPLAGLVI